MNKIIIICSIITITVSNSLEGQGNDSTLIYYKTLEYHLSTPQSEDEPKNDVYKKISNGLNILLVLPDNIATNFPDTCCGQKLHITNYSDLSELRLKSKRDIDFLEVEQAYLTEDDSLVIPIMNRIAVKKRKKVIMGIYIGFEYQIQVSENFNEIKIKRLSHHFE